MGSLRRKTFTKPLPDGAELFTRKGETFAKWKDAAGKTRTAPVTTAGDGSPRIVATSRKWLAKYRRGDDLVIEVPTGCTDKAMAEQFLADLERQADRVRAGVVTTAETQTVVHQQAGIAGHFAAFIANRKAKGKCSRPEETLSQLTRVADACGFAKLADVNATALERWLSVQAENGTGAARRNKYRSTWVAFCNWAIRAGRMLTNPLATVAKADEAADCRRQRRAMTEAELVRLLDVARRRPLLDAMTVRRGKDAGKPICKLRPETVARLDLLGRERALTYKTLVLTGLRKNELATLTVGQLNLDNEPAYLTLDAADEKNREGSTVAIRSDLAADLRQWLADKAEARQDAARNAPTVAFGSQDQNATERDRRNSGDGNRQACQGFAGLPSDTLVFDVPTGLVRILDRDLRLAGISKTDDRGRTIDVHALRHSFGTHLSRAGVEPRTAMACMRHSKLELTMTTYTDPRLLDVAGAVERLPDLPLDAGDRTDAETAARATGTDAGTVQASPWLPPKLPLPSEHSSKFLTIGGSNSNADTELPKREKPAFSEGKRGFPGVSDKWAIEGSNLRHPPCKGVSGCGNSRHQPKKSPCFSASNQLCRL
jgi:integrase